MRKTFALVASLAVLALSGCVPIPEITNPEPVIREFTARDALNVLGIPPMANAAVLGANIGDSSSSLILDYVQALDLIRASEALSKGAHADGVTVFVIDDFSSWKFNDGRYHGDYVSAIIKLVAPQAKVLTCDAWKEDLESCILDALNMSDQIHVVNMSLGILGTYCSFFPGNSNDEIPSLEPPFGPDQDIVFEPQVSLRPDQIEVLEGWVRELRAKGVVVVSSAGNHGMPNGSIAPGCWSSLRVGAVYDQAFSKVEWRLCLDENVKPDDRTCWSDYGNVFAPGAVINDVFKDGISFNGTSASAPFASGVAALVIGTTKLKGEDAAQKIIQTSVSIPDRFNTKLNHVRIDAVLATGVNTPPPPQTLEEFLDKNKNCKIDDEEILLALSLWITGNEYAPGKTISDVEMISVLHKWVKQDNICK